MTRFRLLSLLAFTAPCLSVAQDDALTPQPLERYASVATKSPFALATPVAAPAAPIASFAVNWYVAGLGRAGEDYYATIKSRDAATQFSLYGKDESFGVTLVSVEWSETLGKSKVVLRKGTEMATLEFNEAEVKGPAGAAPVVAAKATQATQATQGAGFAGSTPKPGMAPGTALVNPLTATKLPFPLQSVPNTGKPVVVTPVQVGRPGLPSPGLSGEVRRRVRPIPGPGQTPVSP